LKPNSILYSHRNYLGKNILGKVRILLIVIIFILLFWSRCGYSQTNKIVINFKTSESMVNKKVFGNNCLGHISDWKPFVQFSNFGSGIWDSKWNEPINTTISFAKDAGISVMRFPGGGAANTYEWKKSVGKNREEFLFGIDELVALAKQMNAEIVYTFAFPFKNEEDGADLVEYLNAPDNISSNKSDVGWARERSKNGHPEPYNVKYFEIGNEVYWFATPTEYAEKYLIYYRGIKKVDPSVNIGAVMNTSDWNKSVINLIGPSIDFGIMHFYPTPIWGEKLQQFSARDIFAISFAKALLETEVEIKMTLKLLRDKTGRDVPLAITEYNGGFAQEKPLPYRHCLGTAILNAELLRIFMKPENKILMANYWNFCNEYWGMIANGFDGTQKTLNNPYYKRPNYYVFEMYHKHFGDALINADVKCDTYDVSKYITFKQRIKDFIKSGISAGGNLLSYGWNIVDFKGAKASEDKGMLELTFTQPLEFNYYHASKHAKVEAGMYYKLSGYIKTENLNDPVGVCLEVLDSRGWDVTKSAASTIGITGTNDWTYVEVIYGTLADTTGVSVIVRRIGDTGPLDGKAYFRDVKLEKFIPELDTKIPYLSVNASKSTDGNKVYLMVINKNMDESITSTIELKDFVPTSEGNAWILNGPSMDATNEVKHDNVKITHESFKINSNPFQFIFEPHSLTAIEIDKK